MATAVTQSILLRRSNLAGKTPDIGSLQLGEIGLNTYDGKAFMHKSGSTDEIVQFVVTGAQITGSINLTGDVTASSFKGDGRYLTGVTASMRPDDFDFNSDPFAGTIGYIQGSGSLYKVASVNGAIEMRYNDVVIANITNTNGFSGSVYGIGDVLSFSSSIYPQFAAGPDSGVWA